MNRYIITIILLITATIINYGYSRPEAKQERRPLKEFPKILGNWETINEQKIDENSMAVLLVDDYIMRTYRNKKGETISLYIGYFENQREGKQVHSPRQCLSGGGWSIIEHREYPLSLPGYTSSKVPINLHLMGKGVQKQIYLWWYHGKGRIYANEYMNKLYLIWDAMTKRRTDGSLVRVNMPVAYNLDKTLETQIDFINIFVPILSEYIPD